MVQRTHLKLEAVNAKINSQSQEMLDKLFQKYVAQMQDSMVHICLYLREDSFIYLLSGTVRW